MTDMKKLVVILASALMLTACSSSVKLDEDASGNGASIYGVDENGVAYGEDPELNNPNSPLYEKSVYFDFDKYTVKEAYRPLVSAHSNYLNTHKARRVVIQGNTDERGGREYNLALGQKRAEAVRRQMAMHGVSENQLEAVSFGKEKPKAEGHNEAAWAQNRRADIVYQ
jgi:peptidoglycan-associated lipoprotein